MSVSDTPRARTLELADGVMLAVVAIWAANNVLTKAAFDRGLDPLVYIALRFAIVTVIIFGFLKWRGVSLRVRRADLPRFMVSGLCGFALYNMLFVVGLSHTSAFSAAVLISLAPIFILLISALLGLEPVRPLQWVGVAFSLLGVAVFIGEKLLAGEPAMGDVLNVIAAFSFAIYGLTTRELVLRYGAPVTTAWSVLIGLVAIVPFTANALWTENWGAIDRIGWVSIVYAAVVSMMIGYALWGWAIARAGAGRSVPYLFLIPVITGILSVAFRGEHLSAAQLAGAAIALAGVAMARIFARTAGGPERTLPAEESGMAHARDSSPRVVSGP